MKSGVDGMADLVHKQAFTVERAGYSITADANLMNKDLVVSLTGGGSHIWVELWVLTARPGR